MIDTELLLIEFRNCRIKLLDRYLYTREVTRADLHQMLQDGFGFMIDKERMLKEYNKDNSKSYGESR